MSCAGALAAFDGRVVVCVGFNDWDNEVWTNQHHLMHRLAARGVDVLFVESLGLRRPSLSSGRDLRRIARRLRRGLSRPRRRDGVEVLSPLVLPLHSRRLVRAANARALAFQVRRALRSPRLRGDVILWGYVPQAETLLEAVRPASVVYHCVDDIAVQAGIDSASFRAAERRFAARADLVIASSPPLADRMRAFSSNVLYAPNVADTALFSRSLEPGPVDPEIARLPAPRLVFVGAIAARKLDLPMLSAIARARPGWSLILLGPVGLGDPGTDVAELAALGNVHLLRPRAQRELPAVLRGADAGLIPYRESQLTESIFPMKVYEYLAAGLPVIASGLPSLRGVADVVVVEGPDAAIRAIEVALRADSPTRRRERSARVQGHSWESRLQEIAAALPR